MGRSTDAVRRWTAASEAAPIEAPEHPLYFRLFELDGGPRFHVIMVVGKTATVIQTPGAIARLPVSLIDRCLRAGTIKEVQ